MELSNKSRFIIFGLVGLLAISAIILTFIPKKNTPNPTPTPAGPTNTVSVPFQPMPVVDKVFPTPSPGDPKMPLNTAKGPLQINNLYKNPPRLLSNSGVGFIRNDNYYMSYYPEDQGFIITLLNPNIKKARADAERDFVQYLGITNDQACLLKVTLNVTFYVNEEAAGPNYGLSFCPNSKPLP